MTVLDSGLLFWATLYIRSLINDVVMSRSGCYIAGVCVNLLAYADDIVLLAPSWHGLQKLLIVWRQFQILVGVRHGNVISPCLLAVFIDFIIWKLMLAGYGASIGGHYLRCLLYVDDICLCVIWLQPCSRCWTFVLVRPRCSTSLITLQNRLQKRFDPYIFMYVLSCCWLVPIWNMSTKQNTWVSC